MVQCIAIMVVFLGLVLLMMTQKIPTPIALIIMAILICIIAGVPAIGKDADGNDVGWLSTVIESGVTLMASAMLALIFGSWMGRLMKTSGVTETIIKKSAELGGDKPIVVTLIMAGVVAILFTSLHGLGSYIIIGSIVLPILMAVGVPAATAGCVFLIATAVGMTQNLTELTTFTGIFSQDMATVRGFSLYLTVASIIALVLYIVIQFKRHGIQFAFSAPVEGSAEEEEESGYKVKGVRLGIACLTPILVVLLSWVAKFGAVTSFLCGIVFLAIFTSKSWSHAMSTLLRTLYDGIKDAAPALALFIALGIIVKAVRHSYVAALLQPALLAVFPKSAIAFILFFTILAPLCLYRGPLNLFGMGTGIAALVIAAGVNPLIVMGGFLSVARIQCAAEPSNSHNMWTANFCNTDVNTLLKSMLPYQWVLCLIGTIITVLLYF